MLDRSSFCGAIGILCFELWFQFQSQGGLIVTCSLLSLACNDPQSHLCLPGSGIEPVRRARFHCASPTRHNELTVSGVPNTPDQQYTIITVFVLYTMRPLNSYSLNSSFSLNLSGKFENFETITIDTNAKSTF